MYKCAVNDAPLAIRVLYIEPEDIHRNISLIEFRVDRGHILFVVVVPTALMVGERE